MQQARTASRPTRCCPCWRPPRIGGIHRRSVASTADSVASTADPGAPPAVPATEHARRDAGHRQLLLPTHQPPTPQRPAASRTPAARRRARRSTPFTSGGLGIHGAGAHRGRHRLGVGDDRQHRGSGCARPAVDGDRADRRPGHRCRRHPWRARPAPLGPTAGATPLRTRRRPDVHQRPAGDRRPFQPGRHGVAQRRPHRRRRLGVDPDRRSRSADARRSRSTPPSPR